MRQSLLLLCTFSANLAMASLEHQDNYLQAVNDPSRPADAQSRDSYRKPLEVLRFAGVEPGTRVLEIAPGSGYYTAILSRVLGDTGSVLAVDPERLFEIFEQGREGFKAYRREDPRSNVHYSSEYLDEVRIDESLDQIWMVLYYHDTLWTGEDRQAMNASFFEALKPGGRYLLIDHHALTGAPASVGRDLHRMDMSIAVRELQEAGFVLVKESDALSNPDDPRNDSVFDENRRGKTDRFMLLFEKPST